jgi:hypothetical protein
MYWMLIHPIHPSIHPRRFANGTLFKSSESKLTLSFQQKKQSSLTGPPRGRPTPLSSSTSVCERIFARKDDTTVWKTRCMLERNETSVAERIATYTDSRWACNVPVPRCVAVMFIQVTCYYMLQSQTYNGRVINHVMYALLADIFTAGLDSDFLLPYENLKHPSHVMVRTDS